MFCPKCGNQVNDGAKFCKHCGKSIESRPTNPTPARATAGASAAAATATAGARGTTTRMTTAPAKAYAAKGTQGAATGLGARNIVAMVGGAAAVVGAFMPWFHVYSGYSSVSQGVSALASAFGSKMGAFNADYSLFTCGFFGSSLSDYYHAVSSSSTLFFYLYYIPTLLAVLAAVLLVVGAINAFNSAGRNVVTLRLASVAMLVAAVAGTFAFGLYSGSVGVNLIPGLAVTVIGSLVLLIAPHKAQ